MPGKPLAGRKPLTLAFTQPLLARLDLLLKRRFLPPDSRGTIIQEAVLDYLNAPPAPPMLFDSNGEASGARRNIGITMAIEIIARIDERARQRQLPHSGRSIIITEALIAHLARCPELAMSLSAIEPVPIEPTPPAHGSGE